jgi:DNA-binding transcriptional LysR family regulator
LNIHHLELFYYVAKHRGISAASRKMAYGIQQPAISGQIAQLEKVLGLNLFRRRPFSLTPAGSKLFHEIETFFSGLKELPEQIRDHANRRLRLAAPARILRDYLPGILGRYRVRFPNFKLTLFDANQSAAEELLRNGEIDLAITELGSTPGVSINAHDLIRLPLTLVVPKRSRFRTFGQILGRDGPSMNLISLPSDEAIAKHFDGGLRKLRFGWSPAIELGTLELIETYVTLGFGAGMSIAVPGRKIRSDLRVITLQNFPRLTIAALWVGRLPEFAALLLDDVKKLATRMNRQSNRNLC